jgi:poly(3-hydroxybutyrate) depolymerase
MKLKMIPCLFGVMAVASFAVSQQAPYFALDAGSKYWIKTDAVYGTENGHENKLDVIYPHNATTAVPAVIYFHGGGWIWGDKSGAVLETLPYLQMGWAAVNVEYRMASASKAPAAVEDCRCALRWIVRNAKEYHIDPSKLVVTGHSAGGHLSHNRHDKNQRRSRLATVRLTRAKLSLGSVPSSIGTGLQMLPACSLELMRRTMRSHGSVVRQTKREPPFAYRR